MHGDELFCSVSKRLAGFATYLVAFFVTFVVLGARVFCQFVSKG